MIESKRLPLARLLGLTFAAFLIHGYHLGVEDAEIYIPAAKKLLNPRLYPFGDEFFLSHAHLSLFSPILAWTARLTHLSMDWTILLWYLLTLFAMLAACWQLAAACFESSRARWSSLLVITAVLAMPATNTGLLLMDPYLTARSLSTPLTLFALAALLEARYALAAVLIVMVGSVHPQMVAYLLFLTVLLWLHARAKRSVEQPVPVLASFALLLPDGFRLAPASGPYREALFSRDYFFLYNWTWYHWLGMLAPLAILACFWKFNLRGTRPAFQRLSFIMIPFGVISIVAAMVLASSPSFEMFARLQPLRTFHLITIVFVLLLAGVFGEYVAARRPWAIAALVLPLAGGMFWIARATYPNSPQVELPGMATANRWTSNPWIDALLWIRGNTPEDAVFAVDARYFKDPITDVHGFRAISERSSLADFYKDSGVVSLFPDLAVEWKQMSTATEGLNHFDLGDFERLRGEYPVVSWTIIHGAAPAGLDCPYQRGGYAVCKLANVPDGKQAGKLATRVELPGELSHLAR
uniref:Glycosyltransferase RgtA/B/C/D-like domain-containing protein n=1 Tax=mine drainage metagenome TaxID=410659 RepID=E6QIM8_9ZZZZ